ncbi:hydroquinone glucosyltransferase-like [Senna tora]|uniref:Hydroquinone glucosyltransferase-like n=1 Tax=Senna tora TaxID=362788 RepID=A0A834SS93_9FABA|nr:hydroquinone glucosyltransferase-like [Senna tora]
MEKTTYIAVIPCPGFSHLVPILELSKRLIHYHPHFHITCIIPTHGSPPTTSTAYLQTLPPNIDTIFLPPVTTDDTWQLSDPVVQINLVLTKSLPSLHNALRDLNSKTPFSALVADVFAIEALDFAKELSTLSFVYFASPAMTLSLLLHMPKLDEMISGEFRDQSEPILIPGCVPLHGRDLPDPVQERSSQAYEQFLQLGKRLYNVDGILLNSFMEMEEGPIKALTQEGGGNSNTSTNNPPVYPVGPITYNGSKQEDLECLRWLDKQPSKSVLYVSFGSGGTLSQHQINELALGLELSEKKFLWVLRAPSNIASSAYLGSKNEDPLEFLPQGFLERTKEQGLVVPSWAPQIPILSHSSVGGFLSHCGWNSTLESVQKGVPFISWPLFAEQRMTAVMISEDLKVGVRPEVDENGIVVRDEIAKVIKCLMEDEEGEEIKKRMKGLKDAAVNAVKDDGSSTKALLEVALKWTNFSGV